jgi:plastocyanin
MPEIRSIVATAGALAFLVAVGCSSGGSSTTGAAGTNGAAGATGTAGTSGGGGGSGTAGTAGGGGGSSGGTGGAGDPSFMAVEPCTTEAVYATGSTIDFTSTSVYAYTPQCLKVSAGATVTFVGDFGTHPLEPSAKRGMLTGNPITDVFANPDGGTSASVPFTFPNPGFYAYFCAEHGASDGAAGMVGVIWVQ